MHRERQAILSLIAMGRITPREAERLLAAWNAGREEIWIIGGCAVAGLAQWVPSLLRLALTFLPIHHANAVINYGLGGAL
jgi:hypothetical protein